ncbi:MAG TPA: ferritin-like domain-containing protein [Streptosporangiaceae bacterium]|nr:ferritin-like domain-containing protein [Streptosporangiaceae bacterium]
MSGQPASGGQPAASRISAADVATLQAVLGAEQAACYGYGVVGSHLSGAAAAAATTDWIAHQQARDNLAAIITSAGATPVPAAVAYQLPVTVQTAAQAKSLAVILEDDIAMVYMRLVAVSNTGLRALGSSGVTAAALRAAAWRGSTVAFPGLPAGSLRG